MDGATGTRAPGSGGRARPSAGIAAPPAGGPAPSGAVTGEADGPAATPGISLPTISMPRGGGSLRGIGEKFDVAAATGTGSYSVPVPLPAGRGSLSPQLSLGYDTGSGQ